MLSPHGSSLLCQWLSQIAAFECFHMSGDIFAPVEKDFLLRQSVWHWSNNIVTAQRTDPNTTDTLSLALLLWFSIACLYGTWVYVKPLNTSWNESSRPSPFISLHLRCIYSICSYLDSSQIVKLINTFALIVMCFVTFLQVLKLMTVTCRSVAILSHAW